MSAPHPAKATDRATLRDVARLAGVSEISVSRVMRGASNVSLDMRERVVLAANTLGYTPNRVAGALKTQQSNQVAVVVPSMSHAVFPEVLDGIESVLSAHGLCAVLGVTRYDPAHEINVVRELLSWSPMGMILTGADADPAIERMVAAQDTPVVQIMDVEGRHIGASVGICHRAAGRAAADALVDRGFSRPAYVGAWRERPVRSRLRREAFAGQLAARGAPLLATKIMDAPSSAPVGRAAVAALLEADPTLDSVFFANDDLAVGGLFHAMAAGLSVPGQLGILGFNGIPLGEALPIPLTSLATPRFAMGATAARLLVEGKATAAHRIDLGFSLTAGASI
ncbi:MAG: LacI family DNA-binding transcriptional regulator [Pseudomonadota bacterium]